MSSPPTSDELILSSQSHPLKHSWVKEFRVLYTTDVKQKLKKWHDGTLRFFDLNKKVQVLSESGVVIKTDFLKDAGVLDAGEDFSISGGLMVNVEELTSEYERDISNLYKKSDKRYTQLPSQVKSAQVLLPSTGPAVKRIKYSNTSQLKISPHVIPLSQTLPTTQRQRHIGLRKRKVPALVQTPAIPAVALAVLTTPLKKHTEKHHIAVDALVNLTGDATEVLRPKKSVSARLVNHDLHNGAPTFTKIDHSGIETKKPYTKYTRPNTQTLCIRIPPRSNNLYARFPVKIDDPNTQNSSLEHDKATGEGNQRTKAMRFTPDEPVPKKIPSKKRPKGILETEENDTQLQPLLRPAPERDDIESDNLKLLKSRGTTSAALETGDLVFVPKFSQSTAQVKVSSKKPRKGKTLELEPQHRLECLSDMEEDEKFDQELERLQGSFVCYSSDNGLDPEFGEPERFNVVIPKYFSRAAQDKGEGPKLLVPKVTGRMKALPDPIPLFVPEDDDSIDKVTAPTQTNSTPLYRILGIPSLPLDKDNHSSPKAAFSKLPPSKFFSRKLFPPVPVKTGIEDISLDLLIKDLSSTFGDIETEPAHISPQVLQSPRVENTTSLLGPKKRGVPISETIKRILPRPSTHPPLHGRIVSKLDAPFKAHKSVVVNPLEEEEVVEYSDNDIACQSQNSPTKPDSRFTQTRTFDYGNGRKVDLALSRKLIQREEPDSDM
ncbi:hypothetical protein BABINDRAFT_158869 [Babjeviella inositovora NRRL Y-12698]|uniref:5'-3' DNA helicase ZGRF1-like N-terminal domain-containing protein n=1 Tax=Babjeviella inositovora NRRL Y-12698 TaxID=984486 RepID=A0A1E3QX56_9ASCO|nr:uncharacterized protein BABINDRAFT_158869 [Babjeviella inositovora NRRL Y-12698]ODQ82230.1 hypothetical protein BABINDRAFT_158869 [Babjeviella inositovora NRRL Y-12698]